MSVVWALLVFVLVGLECFLYPGHLFFETLFVVLLPLEDKVTLIGSLLFVELCVEIITHELL